MLEHNIVCLSSELLYEFLEVPWISPGQGCHHLLNLFLFALVAGRGATSAQDIRSHSSDKSAEVVTRSLFGQAVDLAPNEDLVVQLVRGIQLSRSTGHALHQSVKQPRLLLWRWAGRQGLALRRSLREGSLTLVNRGWGHPAVRRRGWLALNLLWWWLALTLLW